MTTPVILYDSIIEDASVTGNVTDGSLSLDWFTYDWAVISSVGLPGGGSVWQIGYNITSASYRADKVGIIVTEAMIGLELFYNYRVDGTADNKTSLGTLTKEGPAIFEISIDADNMDLFTLQWEGSGSGDIELPVAVVGEAMTLERKAFLSVQPSSLNPSDEYNRNRSEAGHTVGRTLKRRGIQNEIAFENLSYDWVRDSWVPFTDHMEKKACFWAWDIDGAPLDVAYVESTGNPQATPIKIGGPGQKGYWQVSMPVAGIAE